MIDKKTVQHWLDMHESTNDVIEEVRCGRPQSTTAAEDKTLINFAEQHGESTSSAIAQRKHVDVEPRTVRRRLNEAGIFNLRPRFAPLLNEKLDEERKSRLKWAEVNKKRDWKRGDLYRRDHH